MAKRLHFRSKLIKIIDSDLFLDFRHPVDHGNKAVLPELFVLLFFKILA